MSTDLMDINDLTQLSISLDIARDIITKDYLYQLSDYQVVDLPDVLKNITTNISDYLRIYKFTRFIADSKESVIDKLVTVLNAAYSSHASVVTIISGHGDHTDYYMGIVNKEIAQRRFSVDVQGKTLMGAFSGNFPGMKMEQVRGKRKNQLIDQILKEDYITAVSGIASIRKEKDHSYEKYVQGIEHLVDSVQGRDYNIVIIADPVETTDISEIKMGFESFYNQLSPALKSTISFNESESISATHSTTQGLTETIGESTSHTTSYAESSGWSKSHSEGTTKTKNTGQMIGALAGGAVAMGVFATIAAPGIAPAVGVVKALMVGKEAVKAATNTALFTGALGAAGSGASIGGAIGGGLISSKSESVTDSSTETRNITDSVGDTISQNSSTSTQNSETISEAEGKTHGKTIQISNENKTVKNLLDTIDNNLERIKMCESYGAFQCAAYIISSDPETNAIVATGYNALMRGDESALQASQINNWNAKKKDGKRVKEYLKRFSHPVFHNPQNENVFLTPALMVNSYELAVGVGLPKKSINGLPVLEMTPFGRNVSESFDYGKKGKSIHLGNIFHMGNAEESNVDLNTKSLTMHTFITGSTGSGKSNTVYQMLQELNKQKVGFLVVEPAKGEYKHVFGNQEDVSVYGTNAKITPLLRINPFRFPAGILVSEHIDRLIEIFNVCWPMYAAMPAVLKDSVERAYMSAGWDLGTSENNISNDMFPTFGDVLCELNKVVEGSAFSQEVKDNYNGSLTTRIRSLTNGIYRYIFTNDELGDEKLFDKNVIVDLSRVGSVETKSMIMGILVMRLQEYRMASEMMNAELRHVTVLEEAHNLLKRTSTEQASESSNLLGKAVEMLSNAIAELRTYGEGFIIADQAPGLLDKSVIRNTNTKIILRLPDEEDRIIVGKSANLSDDQIKELAKIPTGVAAVYQNNWMEPVLSKIEYYDSESRYNKPSSADSLKKIDTSIVLQTLLCKLSGKRIEKSIDELERIVMTSSIPIKSKGDIITCLRKEDVELGDISEIIYEFAGNPAVEEKAFNLSTVEEWADTIINNEHSKIKDLDRTDQFMVLDCVLEHRKILGVNIEPYKEQFEEYRSKECEKLGIVW